MTVENGNQRRRIYPGLIWQCLARLGRLLVLAAALVAVVQAMAYGTWALAHRGGRREASADRPPVRERIEAALSRPGRTHRVSEWPGDRPRVFREAPALAEERAAGRELPPVNERLPEQPLVIEPPEQTGPYGGTWNMLGTGPDDVGVYFWGRVVYEGLMRWDPFGQTITPNLATHWESADEGRTYTLHLRRGVRWSDGQLWTADDILFWYESVFLNRELTPTPDAEFVRGGEPMRVEKIDDYTVRFRFKKPNGTFLQSMATLSGFRMVEMFAFPRHYLSRFHPDHTPRAEIEALARARGLGTWVNLFLERYEWANPEVPRLWAWLLTKPPPANPVEFERNPYYWKVDPEGNQLPYLDRLAVEQIFDRETMQLKFSAGDADMQGRHVEFGRLPLFLSRSGGGRRPHRVRFWVSDSGACGVLYPNLNHRDAVLKEIIHDLRFRRALSLAVDRQAINKICFFGLGRPRQHSPHRLSPFYDPDFESGYMQYDPEEANRLLDDMGLVRGRDGIRRRPDGRPLALTLTSMANGNVESLVVRYWRAVGIAADLKIVGRDQMFLSIRSLSHDVAYWGGGNISSPTDAAMLVPQNAGQAHAFAYGQWYVSGRRDGVGEKPPPAMLECMDLYDAMRGTNDPERQAHLFRRILAINRDQLWYIGLVGGLPSPVLVRDNFRNVPETAVESWTVRSPAHTAPECYARQE